MIKTIAPFVVALTIGSSFARAETPVIDVDVCVYGATPSGILAALAVQREGHTVVIVEPSRWVGGMLGAGLKPTQDCPNIHATGGMTRLLLTTLGQPVRVVDGKEIREQRSNRELSPKDIRQDFSDLLQEHEIRVIHNHRVRSCDKDGPAIRTATFDLAPFDELGCPTAEPEKVDALRVAAAIFIDATYEGDLMAVAGVTYRVGRESAAEFDEEHAGVQPPMEVTPIDPFVEAGNPESGLLAWVEDDQGKPIGAADGYTQAYNYRYYTTDDPEYRAPLTPPPDYDPREFELVGRYVEYLTKTIEDPQQLDERLTRIFPGWMNSREWNYHRESLFTMAPVGISQLYANGDYTAKARVWKQHQDYLRGLHHFMSTDPRVPEAFRQKTAALGLDMRYHPETHGWPHQLYIRVSRRMAGRYTITAHDVYNRTTVDDPIGLAQYGIDTYPARRIWFQRDGRPYVALEGKMFIGGSRGPTNVPYPIPYRAITPKGDECTNLLVPVCFSATHLGYASARMEPVFMICGESAGIAACHALAENTTVQRIDMRSYREAIERAGQVLEWTDERARQGPQT
ncbi:MAG: FAD-dependent oxidoreductase, partial [Planctomycetes bacterium]|nr:FAD-dependent oxidoreductase [Planctomycetota bacterium]